MKDQRLAEGGSTLPTGTVTLLLADVEGSTRLWEGEPDTMTRAVACLDELLSEVVAARAGVRPVEQGEGDSFVIAFTRASDAVAAALDLQRADTSPIRLRIGIHTGEVQLRDEGNYIGPAIIRAARLRNTAHGAQTVVSQATHDLVVDRLPEGASLLDLGDHRLRDLTRPERVFQLCHPDLAREFPPLTSLDAFAHNLPVQLTSLVGREQELETLRGLLAQHRLVTLTGAGGAGKTRLAVQLGAEVVAEHADGVWLVDLAPVTDPDVVPIAVARALGLLDDPAQTTIDAIRRHLASRSALVILDNCEHLVAPCAALVDDLLRSCPRLTVVATSREPLGVGGEVTYRIPPLHPGEAMTLFAERAARSKPGFVLTEGSTPVVTEICERLDGIPLAIELAAARVRVLAPEQIASGLSDRFRLLTTGSRTALPRQQTLRASVEWSHDQLTEPERILFRRLAAFPASFDLSAAAAVCAGEGLEDFQVADQLFLLVDKSLVLALEAGEEARYRLPETVRHYAIERLDDAGESDEVRRRHRDHYVGFAGAASLRYGSRKWFDRSQRELDNLRAAFAMSTAHGDINAAAVLALSMWPLGAQGLWTEVRSWFDTVLEDADRLSGPLRVRVLAGGAHLAVVDPDLIGPTRGKEAVALARELGDPDLLAFALTWLAASALYVAPELCVEAGREAVDVARAAKSRSLPGALAWLGVGLVSFGETAGGRACLEEAVALEPTSLPAAAYLSIGMFTQGDLADARSLAQETARKCRDYGNVISEIHADFITAFCLALSGEPDAAFAHAQAMMTSLQAVGLPSETLYAALASGVASIARGDHRWPREHLPEAIAAGAVGVGQHNWLMALVVVAEAELAAGNAEAASTHVEQAASRGVSWSLPRAWALRVKARIAAALGRLDEAEALAHDALAILAHNLDKVGIADALEQLGALTDDAEVACRLFGAAEALRQRTGSVRFEIYRDWFASAVARARGSMSVDDFERAWGEGNALSMDEAVAYAQRGRGERKRPSTGWASLTPAELDVVRLLGEGLTNKDIAAKLFISPRTVQAHLTHVYAKVGVSSRVQLAHEARSRC